MSISTNENLRLHRTLFVLQQPWHNQRSSFRGLCLEPVCWSSTDLRNFQGARPTHSERSSPLLRASSLLILHFCSASPAGIRSLFTLKWRSGLWRTAPVWSASSSPACWGIWVGGWGEIFSSLFQMKLHWRGSEAAAWPDLHTVCGRHRGPGCSPRWQTPRRRSSPALKPTGDLFEHLHALRGGDRLY